MCLTTLRDKQISECHAEHQRGAEGCWAEMCKVKEKEFSPSPSESPATDKFRKEVIPVSIQV